MTWQSFSNFRMNDSGQVALLAFVDAGTDYRAVLVGDGGNLTQVARDGTLVPRGNGMISQVIGTPQVNNHGHVVFEAELNHSPDEAHSVFLHDGVNLVQVVGAGQPLAGSTVTSAGVVGINDNMQVVYRAGLANGSSVIARFEPSIYWSNSVSGNWGTSENWSLDIEPRDPYDVFIIAENGLTVSGPTSNRTVKSLTVGAEDSASARLQLASGATLTAINGTIVRPNGALAGLGTLVGPVVNQGVVTPGTSPGTLIINGNFTQTRTGELEIEIASATNYDQLLVAGDIALAGTLSVSLLDNFVPTEGQTFTIFGNQFDSLTGAFESVVFPSFNGLTFDLMQSPDSISLHVVPNIGDFNRDDVFDSADADILTRGIAADTSNPELDITADGSVNSSDLARWLSLAARKNGFLEPYLLGDTDLDGVVNFQDFVNFNNNWQATHLATGATVAWSSGDFDGNGVVEFADFVSQNNNWQRAIAPAAATLVPEPSTFVVAMLAALRLALQVLRSGDRRFPIPCR